MESVGTNRVLSCCLHARMCMRAHTFTFIGSHVMLCVAVRSHFFGAKLCASKLGLAVLRHVVFAHAVNREPNRSVHHSGTLPDPTTVHSGSTSCVYRKSGRACKAMKAAGKQVLEDLAVGKKPFRLAAWPVP